MPRSPWLASAGCTNSAGVPVEASVAAILRPTWPLLPMPITTTRPGIRASHGRPARSRRPGAPSGRAAPAPRCRRSRARAAARARRRRRGMRVLQALCGAERPVGSVDSMSPQKRLAAARLDLRCRASAAQAGLHPRGRPTCRRSGLWSARSLQSTSHDHVHARTGAALPRRRRGGRGAVPHREAAADAGLPGGRRADRPERDRARDGHRAASATSPSSASCS